MSNQTLLSPDVAVGEQVQVEVADGSGVRLIAVIGSSASPGGVATVTASSPLASSGGANPDISIASPVPVADGGTGVATLTAHGVLVGEGAGNIVATAVGAAGQVLTSNGAGVDPTFQTPPVVGVASVTASSPLASSGGLNPDISIASPVPVADGGTGVATLTAHGVLVGEGAGSIVATAVGAAGQVLTSNGAGVDPSFQPAAASGVATVTASSPLASSGGANPNLSIASPVPVGDGGTGVATLTAHGVLVGEGAGNIVATAVGTAGQLLTSNGAGVDPSFQTPPATTWINVAASATQAVAAQSAPQFFAVDSTGAQAALFNFPATGAAVDGQEVTIILEGASAAAGVNLAPGAGNVMADPNGAGLYGGVAATLTTQTPGAVVKRKYNTLGAKWRQF